jgi:hypothetical protein
VMIPETKMTMEINVNDEKKVLELCEHVLEGVDIDKLGAFQGVFEKCIGVFYQMAKSLREHQDEIRRLRVEIARREAWDRGLASAVASMKE